jgi:hypothetical protein
VIDVAGVPHGLEQGVGETQRHEVLHRLFSEIVIDAVDLRFGEDLADRLVQGAGRGTRLAERLFDDDAGAFGDQFVIPAGRRSDRRDRRRQIEDADVAIPGLRGPANRFLARPGGDIEAPGTGLWGGRLR